VLTWRVLLLPLLGGLSASATPPSPRRMSRCSLYLTLEPSEEAPEILVWARTLTTLRFDSPVDALQTKLEGGEARFEPLLVGDRFISVFPLRVLAPEDRGARGRRGASLHAWLGPGDGGCAGGHLAEPILSRGKWCLTAWPVLPRQHLVDRSVPYTMRTVEQGSAGI
jgi:hypothetical protein